jgi:hypothetical protein
LDIVNEGFDETNRTYFKLLQFLTVWIRNMIYARL